MSETTLLETAQNPIEAAPATTIVDPAVTPAAETIPPQQASDEPPPAAAAAENQPAAETPKVDGPPETYEFTAPEGQSYDPQVITAYSEAARKANLTQEAAQTLIEAMGPALAARQVEQVDAIHKQWAGEVLADKEIGGELGSDAFKQKMGVAKKFVTTFDQDGALEKLLEDTGLGSHPVVLRVLYRAGKAISEDTFVGRGGREGGVVDPLAALYPTTVNKE